MITLDQIKQLDIKIRKAIEMINLQKSENIILQKKLDTYQLRIEELEILIDTFKEDQGEIEHGIIDALNQLDTIENSIESSTVVSEDQTVQKEEPVVETTVEPIAEPVVEITVETVVEPVVETTVEITVETVAEPVVEPVAEPVDSSEMGTKDSEVIEDVIEKESSLETETNLSNTNKEEVSDNTTRDSAEPEIELDIF